MTWTTRPRSRSGGLAYIASGEGSRLLLIHGVGLRAEAWNAQIDALSGSFEILVPDMPGHGQSEPVAVTASLADFSNSIAALLDRPTLVVGHSMGAMIALELAANHPEHVCGVAAFNAIFRRNAQASIAVRTRADTLDGISVPDPAQTLSRWFGDDPSPERQACEDWLSAVDPAAYRTAYRIFSREDGPSDTALRELLCPAFFLTGGREPNSTPAMSKAMAELAPNGRAAVVETAAHMMPMTHPDEVSDLLGVFAKECLR